MLIGRVETATGTVWVRVAGDQLVPISDPFDAHLRGQAPRDLGAPVTGAVLAPVQPMVVVGMAQNGPEHPSPIQAWLKNPRSVVASGVEVTIRPDAGSPVIEGEICAVIARDTTGLTADNAHTYVLGITAVNDVSSPDRAAFDPRNFEGKAGIGYTPLGPWIDTDAVLEDLALTVAIDGDTVAETSSAALPASVRECLAYVAHWTPLGAGDIVMMGAPFSAAPIAHGQTATIRVGAVELVTRFI